MRGEHFATVAQMSAEDGSSPHARGARIRAVCPAAASRIIPACAGSTRICPAMCLHKRDHPRMRGEHVALTIRRVSIMGSSPHARGALRFIHKVLRRLGIIPACAGSTYVRMYASIQFWDHPRMRGEHASRALSHSADGGSSPHARGALKSTSSASP